MQVSKQICSANMRLSGIAQLFLVLLAFACVAATPTITTVSVPGAATVLKAKITADQTIHLVFQSEDGTLKYSLSKDRGKTWANQVSVLNTSALKPGLEFHLWDMSVDSSGTIHLALGSNAWKLKLPQNEWGFFYTRLQPGSASFSPLQNINQKPSEGFSIAASGDGRVTAAFLSGKLFAMTSNDGGRTFADWRELNPLWNPCDCCTTAITYGSTGELALLYREETGNQRDIYLVLWDQSKNELTRRRISTTGWEVSGCPMTYYTIAPTTTGYLAAWPTQGQIYWARLDSKGNLLPPGEIKTSGRNGMRTGLTILSGKENTILLCWNDGTRLHWQLFDGQANQIGSPGELASKGKGAAAVSLNDGSFLVFP